jgi:outer membrane protein
MKLLRTTILTVSLLAFLGVHALAQNKSTPAQINKIGTVDLRKLFDGYWKTKEVQTVLNERKAQLDNDDKNMRDDLKKGNDEYQKLQAQANDPALAADQREKRKQAATDKYNQLVDSKKAIDAFERQAQITLTEQSQRMRENLLSDIKAAVTAQAKVAGCSLVLDAAAETANATTTVIYNNGENDLTDTVLKRLNAGRTDSTTAAPVLTSPSSLLGQ